MNVIETAGLRFGEGLPKICVPLTGQDMNALREELKEAAALPADLYEWRVDCFSGDPAAALPEVAKMAGRPLLCTIRTQQEGGNSPLGPEEYERAVRGLLDAGGFPLIDIEFACGWERAARLVELARERGVATVVSKHYFTKTPTTSRMLGLLTEMKALGADLPKLAVMPRTAIDVLRLMEATVKAQERLGLGPVITMSMGALGKISRAAGGFTGSCMTFGAGANASAPGQIPAGELAAVLKILGGKGEAGCEK